MTNVYMSVLGLIPPFVFSANNSCVVTGTLIIMIDRCLYSIFQNSNYRVLHRVKMKTEDKIH